MIDLFSLYQKLCGTYNTQQGGHAKIRNFVDWVNDISIEMYTEYIANDGKDQQSEDYLMPFSRSVNIMVSNVAGAAHDIIKRPGNYENWRSMRMLYDGSGNACLCVDKPVLDGKTACEIPYHDIDEEILSKMKAESDLTEIQIIKVPNQNWGSVTNHRTLKPSRQRPRTTQQNDGFFIAPKGLGIIILDYYVKPKLGTFAYTIANPGAIDEYLNYDAPNSQKLEWSETLTNEFLNRLGRKYGKFIREQFLVSTSEEDIKRP